MVAKGANGKGYTKTGRIKKSRNVTSSPEGEDQGKRARSPNPSRAWGLTSGKKKKNVGGKSGSDDGGRDFPKQESLEINPGGAQNKPSAKKKTKYNGQWIDQRVEPHVGSSVKETESERRGNSREKNNRSFTGFESTGKGAPKGGTY